jgi:hypothetical protein
VEAKGEAESKGRKELVKGGRRPGAAAEPAPGPKRPPTDPKDRLAARHAQLQKMMQELQEAEEAQVSRLLGP